MEMEMAMNDNIRPQSSAFTRQKPEQRRLASEKAAGVATQPPEQRIQRPPEPEAITVAQPAAETTSVTARAAKRRRSKRSVLAEDEAETGV